MLVKKRSAFTMLELVFAIAIIGILSAVALPKFATTRDDAVVAKAKSTIAAIRASMTAEYQKRILRGDYTDITDLAKTHGRNKPIFDAFDGDTANPVLGYSLRACPAGGKGCWLARADGKYVYYFPISGSVAFWISNNRFVCNKTKNECRLLTE